MSQEQYQAASLQFRQQAVCDAAQAFLDQFDRWLEADGWDNDEWDGVSAAVDQLRKEMERRNAK